MGRYKDESYGLMNGKSEVNYGTNGEAELSALPERTGVSQGS